MLTTHHRQDRPDLIQSELAGLAFDSLQQVFRKVDINFAFETAPLDALVDQTVWLVVDPAAGGPSSDFAVLSMSRQRGSVTVSASREQIAVYALLHEVGGRARLVGEEAHSQHLPQVEQEARHFGQIQGRVQIDYLVLEHGVDVEQQEKQNAARAVRGASDLFADLRCLCQQNQAVKCLCNTRDGVLQEGEELRLVAGVAQADDHVVYFAFLPCFLGRDETSVADKLSRAGTRHRCAKRLQGTHQIVCIFFERERARVLFARGNALLFDFISLSPEGMSQKYRGQGASASSISSA